MLYNNFKDMNLSRLGFGTMRLPVIDGKINEDETIQMIDYAMENGINYFDTAYPYMSSKSEVVVGKALARHQRDSFYLADKFPGHQIADSYYPEKIFEEQLSKCQVEYFDFYLLHNVCETSYDVYTDPKWHIIDYFVEQKRLGRIRNLGFSTHAQIDTLRKFLAEYADIMDMCQIQLNYLDWTLQDAKTKYEIVSEYNLPIWVMEPLRGGKLVNLKDTDKERLTTLRPNESTVSWAFRWLMGLPNVKVILSGMSNMEQMIDNVRIFAEDKPLTDAERDILMNIAEGMKNGVPCTSCHYCCDSCPMELDIPLLIQQYNDLHFSSSFTPLMLIESMPEEKRPSACLGCGACASNCPQNIDIPNVMSMLAEELSQRPSWAAICKQRAEEAKKAE